jgi:hypothetical protein
VELVGGQDLQNIQKVVRSFGLEKKFTYLKFLFPIEFRGDGISSSLKFSLKNMSALKKFEIPGERSCAT